MKRGSVFAIGLLVAVVAFAQGAYQTHEFAEVNAQQSSYRARTFVKEDLAPPSQGMTCVALGILPLVSFPNENYDVYGLRINVLAGRHRSLYGLDVGLVGNSVSGNAGGLQVAGFYNTVGSSSGALQCALFFNRARQDFTGLQSSWVNLTEETLQGVQLGLGNMCCTLNGFQSGLINKCDVGGGVQIGLLNFSTRLSGVQIGLLNFNDDSLVPVCPILNCAF